MPRERLAVLIFGAGIAGCSLAYHLARRQVGAIGVYDPRTPAAGATGRAGGVVTEQLWNEWDVQVTREAHAEYRALAQRHRPEAYSQNGFVRWTKDPVAATVLREAVERLRSWKVDVETVGPAELARWMPWGRFDDVRMGILSRGDAVVTPSAIAEIYVEEARRLGVDFRLGSAGAIAPGAGGRPELELGGDRWAAENIVVAAGAWSKRLFADLGHPLPLMPYRTQAATLRPPHAPPEVFPTGHDIDTEIYARPEGPGRILAGDGTELVEADPERFVTSGDDRFRTHLAEAFGDRFPGWADSEMIAAWAGVCTSTPDRRPLVGEVPGAPGLYAMTGFNGFGVMRAGGVARRLADRIADGPGSRADDELRVVRPDRFHLPYPPFAPRPGFTVEGGDSPRF
ncbi:MAG: FAD-binding oxidoreductase [Thermoplasmata archaeon]